MVVGCCVLFVVVVVAVALSFVVCRLSFVGGRRSVVGGRRSVIGGRRSAVAVASARARARVVTPYVGCAVRTDRTCERHGETGRNSQALKLKQLTSDREKGEGARRRGARRTARMHAHCAWPRARHAAAVPPVVMKQTFARYRRGNGDERRERQRGKNATERRTADDAR